MSIFSSFGSDTVYVFKTIHAQVLHTHTLNNNVEKWAHDVENSRFDQLTDWTGLHWSAANGLSTKQRYDQQITAKLYLDHQPDAEHLTYF